MQARDWGGVGVLAALGVAAGLALNDRFLLRVLTLVLLWAFAAAAWNITAKAGQISLGHSAFTGLGAFAFALPLIHWNVTPWAGLLVAAVAGAAAAVLIGVPSFRLQGFYFVLATIAYPLILMLIFIYLGYHELTLPFRPNQPWYYMEFRDARTYVWIALAMLVAIQVLVAWLERNRFGYYLRAIRDNEILARAVGLRTSRWKTAAFALSGALTAVMGVVWVKSVLFVVTAEQVFGLLVIIQILSIVFIGGIASRWGPVVGAVLLVPLAATLDQSVGDRVPGVQYLVYGIALMLVALLAPEGIVWRARAFFAGRTGRVAAFAHAVSGSGPALRPPAVDERGATAAAALGEPVPQRSAAEEGVPHDDATPQRAVARLLRRADDERHPRGDAPLLTVTGVTKSFGGVVAVDRVSLDVQANELLGIIGPNGAGKTTLFNILTGYLRPDSGTVTYEGTAIGDLGPPERYHRGISRTFQVPQGFQRMSPLENVMVAAMGAGAAADEWEDRAHAALDLVGFGSVRGGALTELTTLEFKLLEVARAVVSGPRLLLVDEPLAGLNPAERGRVIDVLTAYAEHQATVVVIEHSVRSLVTFVERIIALDTGRVIASGTPEDVVSDPVVITAYLGKKWSTHAQDS